MFTAVALVIGPIAVAGPQDDGLRQQETDVGSVDPSDALEALDHVLGHVVSEGPSAKVIKNLDLVGRGERLLPNATTDVWAHRGTAYLGTFNDPCGTGEGFRSDTGPVSYIQDRTAPGVVVFNVRNVHKPRYLGNLPSVEGSRINDVKVARQGNRDILVHSNEACDGGDGGFEVYDMTNPRNPIHLASVRVDDANQVLRELFEVVNVGVHNLFLFSQGDRHFVALQTHAEFGSFQIYELTDPTNPQFVSAWGAEFLCEGAFCSPDPHAETDPNVILDVIFGWMRDGFGTSRNRYLHDMTISADGTRAYLASWDAGLVLLDISDPANPQLVSVALDPTAGDGEVNSHAAWPSEDGRIVVETEEDFDYVRLAVTVTEGPLQGEVFSAFEDVGGPPPPRLADVGVIEAEAVWVGQLCNGDPVLNQGAFDEGDIAVARRGACTFAEKLLNAQALGASAILIANNLPGQPALSSGTFGGVGDIPGLFISTAAGDAFEANQTGNTVRLDPDAVTFNPWGNVRIWDYSDPTNPVLASEFDTVCSRTPDAAVCDPRGTYSVHNVVVEKGKAYFSWYSNGVIIVDVSDPYNPVEVARYNPTGEAFEAQNAGIQDVWGIWKERGRPWLYASDRNGGLYILKEKGAGTLKKQQGKGSSAGKAKGRG